MSLRALKTNGPLGATLEGFRAFLSEDPNREFAYLDVCGCAVAQYVQTLVEPSTEVIVDRDSWSLKAEGKMVWGDDIPAQLRWDDAAHHASLVASRDGNPLTFAHVLAALDQAQAVFGLDTSPEV